MVRYGWVNGDGYRIDVDDGMLRTLIGSGKDVNVLALQTISSPVIKYGFTIGIPLFYTIVGVLRRGGGSATMCILCTEGRGVWNIAGFGARR